MRALFFALTLAVATPAIAAPKTEDASSELRKRGEEAFRAKSYREALGHYLAASKVVHDPALLYNIARCHHELGEYADAHRYYTRFALEAPVDLRTKVPHLDEKLADVTQRTSVVKVTANVVGATVAIDDKVIGESGSLDPLRINAGTITVTGKKSGYSTDTRKVEAPGGSTITVQLVLVAPPPSAPVAKPAMPAESSGSYWWLWTGLAVVVVSGAVVTYALVTERGADTGSHNPGQLGTGLTF